MTTASTIDFGPDKSQILRGLAIIFMITLHNDTLPEFKICVPIFTFLVGYGYAFAKEKSLRHGLKRSWHLLSHFWLILLGLFLPVAIWKGGYEPTIGNVLLNMFGLESNLNWYSWYIYFYIFAMLVMIPASRLIQRFKLPALGALIVVSLGLCAAIHLIPDWSSNVWLQAIHDCFLCSPVMYSGFYLAEGGAITHLEIKHNFKNALLALLVAVGIFFLRGLPFATFLDFATVPVFVAAVVIMFNIVNWQPIHSLLIALGKESMNMWFFHAIFATTCTAVVFAPLVDWLQPKTVHILGLIIISYCIGKLFTAAYNRIGE